MSSLKYSLIIIEIILCIYAYVRCYSCKRERNK